MYLVRIDNRLVHGQIIETWIPYAKTRTLVVADDDLAGDALRQEIMGLAIPHGVDTRFLRVEEVSAYVLEQSGKGEPDILVLFSSCQDARRAHEAGLALESINIGNLHYGPGKDQLCAHVALSSDDNACLGYFTRVGITLDFRCIPNDTVQVNRTW